MFKNDRAIQLQFTGLGYEFMMFERGHALVKPMAIQAAQLKQVSLDMRAVEIGQVKFLYEDRCVVIELSGRQWARVPDVAFMRLLDFATEGAGNTVEV